MKIKKKIKKSKKKKTPFGPKYREDKTSPSYKYYTRAPKSVPSTMTQ